MSWLMRGIQSAVFHYVSCAPCTGYMYRKRRRAQAKKDRKARKRLQMEQPELYHQPEPSSTNPYWTEEIVMGPGPPPRRARGRANTGSQRGITTAGTHSTVVSQGGSSIDVNQNDNDPMRMSDDTLDDDSNWNRRRYQREDEDLWGLCESPSPKQPRMKGSSVGVAGMSRPGTSRSKSSADSYYTARVPPVNDLHPPVVSLPSSHPADNRWMLQPPPKASVMSGKERASNRSRSGSGASSRVELSLQRQVSARQLRYKLERGETPEMPPLSRGSSYSNFQCSGQRHDRPRTPQARSPSAASSSKKKGRDTAFTTTIEIDQSSGDSSDTVVHSIPIKRSTPTLPPAAAAIPNLRVVRVRSSRKLSTVISSDSGGTPSPTHVTPPLPGEENLPEKSSPTKPKRPSKYSSTQSSDYIPYLMKHRSPLTSSDVSSLNVLQDLVSPRALLNSRFVTAPLMEARIKLPPSDKDEEKLLCAEKGTTGGQTKTPFDNLGVPERDPGMRWSVDF
ncbi:hypothetical protein K469DRAFT_567088 [Zopfia rhizophila CBS 207.26]|uniref:Signal peptide-containing protein n=1 Tax=Zopfia rhizophila CBS 207.26 TaxID=1314779 RepID=A0A6A6EDD3_9PEZI|nr:hypothetical protein K469DRAFT_567088 [Zopfia rhizophila CBS 207.26]